MASTSTATGALDPSERSRCAHGKAKRTAASTGLAANGSFSDLLPTIGSQSNAGGNFLAGAALRLDVDVAMDRRKACTDYQSIEQALLTPN